MADKSESGALSLRDLKRTELLELLVEVNSENAALRQALEQSQLPIPESAIEEEKRSARAAKAELDRLLFLEKYRATIRSTISILVTVAAIAILVANFLVPAFQIYGNSMAPTLTEGEIVLAVKGNEFTAGDLVAFYYNNKILVKRVIANPGDWVDMNDDGDVYVNGTLLSEPYLEEKALGDSNIEYPYQVPENRVFVLGDHRSVSIDSRNTSIGCVAEEQIVGRLVFRVWPLGMFGRI